MAAVGMAAVAQGSVVLADLLVEVLGRAAALAVLDLGRIALLVASDVEVVEAVARLLTWAPARVATRRRLPISMWGMVAILVVQREISLA